MHFLLVHLLRDRSFFHFFNLLSIFWLFVQFLPMYIAHSLLTSLTFRLNPYRNRENLSLSIRVFCIHYTRIPLDFQWRFNDRDLFYTHATRACLCTHHGNFEMQCTALLRTVTDYLQNAISPRICQHIFSYHHVSKLRHATWFPEFSISRLFKSNCKQWKYPRFMDRE